MIDDRPVPVRRVMPARAGRFQLLLRLAGITSVVVALVGTRAAGEGSVFSIELALAGLAFACAVLPDTHLGLLVIGGLGLNWVGTVDDVGTPWAIVVAISLAVFHTATAASSVAPIAASWTPAMARRWIRRLAVAAAACLPTWALTAAADRADIASSRALVTAALLILAAAGMWVRHGNFELDPPR